MCTNPHSSSSPRGDMPRVMRAGFTLMEIVIALVIIGMLSISMLEIIRNTVRAAAQTEDLRRESDQINRLIESCRKTFTTMPATGTLALKIVQTTEPIIQELTITGSPDCFPFGPNPITFKDTILRVRPHPDGVVDLNDMPLHYFCLSREDLIPKTGDSDEPAQASTTGIYAPDEDGRYWMPLLPDVVSLKWRFYVEKDDTWVEEWSKTQWPDLIELQFTLKDRTTPTRMVFGLPVITITAGRAPAPSTSSSSNTGGGGGFTPPGGGRGDGGGRPSPPQPPAPPNP
ncbi:MAG: prepilin-type N-terminal cleavage/methylation domain-containing protein [Verrucomicrobiaceae bacterium]|nr:prepilin-type N-terminal cleavage/methylation domain-containing protein [Verrucomicrobiaceae bacterium]